MRNIDAYDLSRLIDKKAKIKLINVLPRESFERLYIPTSLSIPYDREDFVNSIEDLYPEKTTTIILYSASSTGNLTQNACRELEEAGYINVYMYRGGIKDWKNIGNKFLGTDAEKFNKAA